MGDPHVMYLNSVHSLMWEKILLFPAYACQVRDCNAFLNIICYWLPLVREC